jgi:hypothetical protein
MPSKEAIVNCYEGLEGVFQRIIEYWLWTQKNDRPIEHLNALLVEALQQAENTDWQKLLEFAQTLRGEGF